MSLVSNPSDARPKKKQAGVNNWHLPRNVYLLFLFTTGKGLQLSVAALTLTLYVHSLGYRPDFIGLFSAMPAIGSMLGAVPTGMLADRIGRKPVLIMTAILAPLFLVLVGMMTSIPWLIAMNFIQGVVSTAYWVTNLPLLAESTTERQRVGVLTINSFLLLGVGALGNLIGGAIPELAGSLLHVSANSTEALRWGIFSAAAFTFLFGLPLWFLHEHKRPVPQKTTARQESTRQSLKLFARLLIPDLVFTMGEGAVVALMQLFFVLRFLLLPGPLGIIFTVSGLLGGFFSLTAPLFTKRWSKLRITTTVQYLSAPLIVFIGFVPNLPLAIAGEYTRSALRALIEPIYAAFVMEQVSDRQRATVSGLYSVSWSIGFSIGPTIAGWLQTNISLSASFIYGAFCLVLAPSLLLAFFGRRPRATLDKREQIET